MNEINIITPVSRHDYLKQIAYDLQIHSKRIKIKWTLIIDKFYYDDFLKHSGFLTSDIDQDLNVTIIRSSFEKADGGHLHRNIALNYISDNDWVYFLDDDNKIHPNFISFVIGLIPEADVYIFDQVRKDRILKAHPLNLNEGEVDMAMIFFKKRASYGIKFKNIYHGDQLFIKEIVSRNKTIFITKIMSYYNELRRT